ncbi:MAG: calcium-binding protein, partial [Chloroflexota bacterium]
LMTEQPAPAGAFGHDYMEGNDGEDEMYGQQGDDFMQGNDQDDVMIGDLGNVETIIEDGSRQAQIEIPAPFIADTIYVEGTLYYEVELFSYLTGDGAEGDDIMLGGAGMDAMHGGAGADIMNGNANEDHLFGGDGPDVMWGGPDHDHLYGGWGDDYLDVVPRTAGFYGTNEPQEADPPEWFAFGSPDNYQEIDYIYGGWDQDAMQASDGGPGPQSGDRLIDWVGAYNVYFVCPDPNGGPYGEGVITRILSPDLIQFLQGLAEADGALDASTRNTSGFREVAIVFAQEAADNAYPVHEEHPGHFTCVP